MADNNLSTLRRQIDNLDEQIQTLISSRAELAQQVAAVKKEQSDEEHSFYRPSREAFVLSTVKKRNTGVLPDADMARIFREIMSACLALEEKLKIAFLGPEGTFTQEALIKHFGSSVDNIDCATIEDIFTSVARNRTHYGVVPIENSTNGIVGITVEMFSSMNLQICGEVEIDIHHQLMAADYAADIKVIYAHQQALDQCRRWLMNHYPQAEYQAVASNALAARLAKDEKHSAAIASEYALSVYGLCKLANNIEDRAGNSTRFLIIGKEKINKTEAFLNQNEC